MAKKDDFSFEVDISKLEHIAAQTPGKIDTWLRGIAEEIVTDVVLSFGTSPDGRTYTRGNVTHIASQPDNPPNVDTGALRASITSERKAYNEYEVMDGVEYGIYLEEGTEHIAPRPFMGPAFENARREIERKAREGLDLE